MVREILKMLVKEYGRPEHVMDSELWFDIKALGTCEVKEGGIEYWSYCGKLYRLCFGELPLKHKEIVCEAYH